MININIDPVLWQVGPFTLRWYGLMIALALLTGIAVAVREARRKGIAEDEIYSFALWAVIAGVIGARALHVIDKFDYYRQHPAAIFALQEGGLAIYGTILFGLLAGVIYAWRRGIPAGRLADVGAPALIIGQAIGRLGCIINGDAYGAPTNVPWALVYSHPNALAPLGVPGQPTPGYELIWDVLVFGVLVTLRRRLRVDGTLFLIYISLYSAGRFVITFWRQDDIFMLGLREAQVVSLAAIVVAVPLMIYLNRSRRVEALSKG